MAHRPKHKLPPQAEPLAIANKANDPELVGIEDQFAMFTDLFVVNVEASSGLTSICFFQTLPGKPSGKQGEATLTRKNKAKLVGNMLLTPLGVEKLGEALEKVKRAMEERGKK